MSPNNSAEDRKLIRYEYQLLTHSALVRAFREIYQIIWSVGREKRVAVLDLAKELNGKREFFTDHVHLSSNGSEKVARRVADFLAPYFEDRTAKRQRSSL